ncbi:MAG TPA: hypothetical protein VNU01_03950 [Egibacteraceae bacterium]|nr:hypothetical protein [Egibacteraceae bacterium]
MTANPPHPPGPGEPARGGRAEFEGNPLSGGTQGILAVTLATLGLALAAAAIAGVVAWLV